MAKPELLSSISSLSGKIDDLMEQHKMLLDKISMLEKQNRELSLQHLKDTEELENAKKEIEFLSLSYRLASSPETIISARNNISRLIRTIDSCIRIIKED